jgi:DNA-binding response OmpR family regulator
LAKLRAEAATHDIPVIVVSMSRRLLDGARAQYVLFGGDRFLVKPFDLDDLLAMVTELIGPA